MQICIFEDNQFENFEPLVLSRPVFDLTCGKNTLREKILRAYPNIKYSLHCRTYLSEIVKNQNPGIEVNSIPDDDCLFINGNVLAGENLSELIPIEDKQNKLYLSGSKVAAARVSGKKLLEIKRQLNNPLSKTIFSELPEVNVDVKTASYIWDLIISNGSELISDLKLTVEKSGSQIKGKVFEGAHLVGKENIFISEGAVVKPGVVLDASEGPIFIDKNAVIFPNAVISGPAYIGDSTLIKSCSTIYKNTTISKVCKIGGEVENSIVLPYSNKQHSGYIGHAYLGSWVNLGADTNCSDLKNNYSSIKVSLNGSEVDTGLQFLGLIMGDHSKTAINTMFNTGTITGFSCNVFGAGFPDKFLPSFTWGGSEGMVTHDVSKSVDTARKVMARRKIEMNSDDEKIFKHIFDKTKTERLKKGLTN